MSRRLHRIRSGPLDAVPVSERSAPERASMQQARVCEDLVTEMREVKRPFRKGIKAQPGLAL